MSDAGQLGIKRLRLTFDPFRLNLRRLWPSAYRALHAVIFHPSSARAGRTAQRGIRHTDAVFASCRMRAWTNPTSPACSLAPGGDSELYSHPSLDEFKNEFDALISPSVREQVKQLGIKLIRYRICNMTKLL